MAHRIEGGNCSDFVGRFCESSFVSCCLSSCTKTSWLGWVHRSTVGWIFGGVRDTLRYTLRVNGIWCAIWGGGRWLWILGFGRLSRIVWAGAKGHIILGNPHTTWYLISSRNRQRASYMWDNFRQAWRNGWWSMRDTSNDTKCISWEW